VDIQFSSLDSHHEVLKKFGEGGMGVVYKARDTKLDCFIWFKSSPKGIDIRTKGSLPANLDGGRPRMRHLWHHHNPERVEYLRSICRTDDISPLQD
jgi:serine/threonine protein kinase